MCEKALREQQALRRAAMASEASADVLAYPLPLASNFCRPVYPKPTGLTASAYVAKCADQHVCAEVIHEFSMMV